MAVRLTDVTNLHIQSYKHADDPTYIAVGCVVAQHACDAA